MFPPSRKHSLPLDGNKRLEILHDHYKETFALQREQERSRDRLFLWVILLFALLSVEIGYPAEFTGSVHTLSVLGTDIELNKLPLAALLSVSWVLTLAMILRYCQTSIAVDRKYPYIHMLEDEISPLVGGGDLYRREGEFYLHEYPLMLNAAFYAYVLIFPITAIVGTGALWYWEANRLSAPWPHKVFDGALAVTISGCLFLYRIQPYVVKWLRRRYRTATTNTELPVKT